MPFYKLVIEKNNKGMMYMKKVIALIILSLTMVSCSELAELETGRQQRLRERGWECRYNGRGEVQHCGYIN